MTSLECGAGGNGRKPAPADYAAEQGMLDILVALCWTRDNIDNFGGDPTTSWSGTAFRRETGDPAVRGREAIKIAGARTAQHHLPPRFAACV
jgi:hypothetical protein